MLGKFTPKRDVSVICVRFPHLPVVVLHFSVKILSTLTISILDLMPLDEQHVEFPRLHPLVCCTVSACIVNIM